MKTLNRKRFTQQGVDRLRYDKAAAPPSGRIEIEDEACPGLLLRVTPRNLKSFSVIYRVIGEGGTSSKGRLLAGKQHRITLGATPPLELTKARRQAREIVQAATEGRDLRTERREKNLIRSVNTFEAVFQRFMEIEIIPNVEAWKNVEGVLRRHVLPQWANTPVHDIRRSHIHELIDELVKQGKQGSAREVRKHLSRFTGAYWGRAVGGGKFRMWSRPVTAALQVQKDLSLPKPQMAVHNMLRDGDSPGLHALDSDRGTIFVATLALLEASRLGLEHQRVLGDMLRVLAGPGAKSDRKHLGEGSMRRQYRGFWLPPLDECRRRWQAHLGREVQWPDGVTSWEINPLGPNSEDGPF
jgi:hypothetical protein